VATIRRRIASSGKTPSIAPALSAIPAGRLVAGVAAVMTGWPITHFVISARWT
jgi:hypothetical protein